MKLYVGANGLRPDGYKTVDIDPGTNPDIVADLCDMSGIQTGTCDEIVATAVMEHIEWPDAFKALSEMVRVLRVGGTLKISVPDMSMYARAILAGDNSHHVMSVIYGLGGRTNKHQAHRYGYTAGMLCEIGELLGCGRFDWFNIKGVQDASGGWMPRAANANIAEALNFSCVKLGEAPILPAMLYEAMIERPMQDILQIASDLKKDIGVVPGEKTSATLYQMLHYKLTVQIQHGLHLEREYNKMRERAEQAEADAIEKQKTIDRMTDPAQRVRNSS